ncbi:hypothetical protein L202_03450 [Cryptococcus amylolentus CBS 6039]|uniref:Uncharacterized protein n=1 Tax=Cryptococcus amylolentus CBS 6039 TaxID=1295533 RepID=A0A1E3HSZ6_9TREE|nr:hypothetical protein L202_03450 [Cryptococcus amylolentus CBS 6039]ODN79479.1 hypothetical protein L202_03450 [Cryptococcus amylolentus CBS 6039]
MPTSMYDHEPDELSAILDVPSAHLHPHHDLLATDLNNPFAADQLLFNPSSHRASLSSQEGDSSFLLSPAGPHSSSSLSPRLSLSPSTGEPSIRPSSLSSYAHSHASALSPNRSYGTASPSFDAMSGSELDLFLLPELGLNSDASSTLDLPQHNEKAGHSLYLPGRQEGAMNDDWIQDLFKDPTFNLGQQPQQPIGPVPRTEAPSGSQNIHLQQHQHVGQTIQPHQMGQLGETQQGWPGTNGGVQLNVRYQAPQPQSHPQPHVQTSKPRAAPVRRTPSAKASDSSAPAPTVGKHNKTERRYRQKVQAAQADLRDAIPALRVLYGTSTPEQAATIDIKAADGTVDGLGEVTRPNASAKATILTGARMYIELLQRRSAKLQRMTDELQDFRKTVEGEAGFGAWKSQFDAKEAEIERYEAEQLAIRIAREEEEESDEDGGEEADQEPSKKRKRAAPAPKKPRAPAKSKVQATAAAGARVFAAFALSFSFAPPASTILHPVPQSSTSQLLGPLTKRQVLSRVPILTAEHTSRLLARALPSTITPGPEALVEWTWKLLIAALLAVLMRSVISRWSTQDKRPTTPGSLRGVVQDLVEFATDKNEGRDEDDWEHLAAAIVGNSAPLPTAVKWHTILHLNMTASQPYTLALLALLQPEVVLLRSPASIWASAQSLVDSTTPAALVTVLQLPLHEVQKCLTAVSPTSAPLPALAEQITLTHIHDLYTRFFIDIVDASLPPSASPSTLRTLLEDLEAYGLGTHLQTSNFDKEIRATISGVQKGSAAHALGLVLIGLWGVFVRQRPEGQASLAASLAGLQVSGGVRGLESVGALLELLYPGCSVFAPAPFHEQNLSKTAKRVDHLALSIIEYISLLLSNPSSSASVSAENKPRGNRKEESMDVQKRVVSLRGILNKTGWVEIESSWDDDDSDDEQASAAPTQEGQSHLETERTKYERAKERLVDVLAKIGRRAAGRARGRDEDSGLEGDLDEL